MKKVVLLIVVGVMCAQAALASEYAAFTSDLVKPYGYFKQALSLTSKKEDIEKAKTAVASLIESWGTFSAKYATDVPKPFIKLPDFSSRIKRPVEVGRKAAEFLKNGDVKQAHMVLEEIRYLMWDLRVKSSIVSLSDKANNFHEVMEIVLDRSEHAKDGGGMLAVEERFGPWLAVAWEELALAPASETSAPGFPVLLQDGRTSVAALRAALRSGDRAAVKQQGNAVKNAYKKVFFMD